MANQKTWVRYNGQEAPSIQGHGAPTHKIEPGKWYEFPADLAAQLEGPSWEKAEKNPTLPKKEKAVPTPEATSDSQNKQ